MMIASNNPKTFRQKLLAFVQAMDTSPADIQWQVSKQQAAQIDALHERVINLEARVAALQASVLPKLINQT